MYSTPSSPSLAPARPELQRSFSNPNVPRRLIIPATRNSRVLNVFTSSHKHKPSTQARLTKGGRPHVSPQPEHAQPSSSTAQWVSELGRFDVVQALTEMDGYQVYAVEKWRGRGAEGSSSLCHGLHGQARTQGAISVTVLAPRADLSEHDAFAELEKAIQLFRKDGARPRETREGVIMVTSLATFRSDLNIVLIPDGNFLHMREQLYVNINLLRMGCSGRTVLNLANPTEATQERFRQLYHIPDSKRPIQESVLDLVQTVQSGLAIFGLYTHERDGLLCDRTIHSIQQWNTDVGGSVFQMELMERPLDPAVVSGLVTLITCIRNKLHIVNGAQGTPRDPFDEPTSFLHSLAQFTSTANSTLGRNAVAKAPVLTAALVAPINAAFDRARGADSYKIHRVVLSKLEGSRDALDIQPTIDLAKFTKFVADAPKEALPPSVRQLWTGYGGSKRPRRRTMDEGTAVKMDEPDMATLLKQQEEEVGDPADALSYPARPRRMKSFDMFSRNKHRRQGLDALNMGPVASPPPKGSGHSLLPALMITGQEELSAGEISPLGHTSATNLNLSDDDLSGGGGPGARLRVNPHIRDNIASWSGPSAGGRRVPPVLQHSYTLPALYETRLDEDQDDEEEKKQRGASDDENGTRVKFKQLRLATKLKRHLSFDDRTLLPDSARAERHQLMIDFQLAGEIMQLHVRQRHLAKLTVLLKNVTSSLSHTNSILKADVEAYRRTLAQIEVVAPKLLEYAAYESERSRQADTRMVQTSYRVRNAEPKIHEAVDDVHSKRSELWGARADRTTYRDRPDGFRILRNVQGHETLVDAHGRTESEAEEEAVLRGVDFFPFPRDADDGRGTWSFWPRTWRERAEDSALSPRTEEADEAGLEGARTQRAWWDWFSARRRIPSPPTHEPLVQGAPILAQKPQQPEHDLINFASEDEDDGYASAVEVQAN
ncbi:hypothetical protein EXIGLDRAFT_758383 [Exidia glandulosa HHB12029]|uniref:STB6-like N-terminal domain-containing protein n=1 Tax=Exidia glandulosa HHB12029 TaxID=1314781 RepID=A0A165QUD2_EXIGL|nr:hypothetical protein EXIGLDRAFT_758383 [Exidia glandulosa HHB12029]